MLPSAQEAPFWQAAPQTRPCAEPGSPGWRLGSRRSTAARPSAGGPHQQRLARSKGRCYARTLDEHDPVDGGGPTMTPSSDRPGEAGLVLMIGRGSGVAILCGRPDDVPAPRQAVGPTECADQRGHRTWCCAAVRCRGRASCTSTLRRILKHLDGSACEAAAPCAAARRLSRACAATSGSASSILDPPAPRYLVLP